MQDLGSILEFNNKESVSDVLSELLRDGAQHLIHQAVELELNEYFSQHQRLTADGRIALVRNGYLPKREILTGIGPVSVRIPKVRSRDWEALTFRSALVPHLCQKNQIPGSSITMAVAERCFYRRDGRSIKSPGRS